MNIFVLDLNPAQAAQYHADKHVVKMILESCQMLCCAHWELTDNLNIPYKKTHRNHPCSIWVRQSEANYNWLMDLLENLLSEYTSRYGKIHKSTTVFEWLKSNKIEFKEKNITPFALAMPDEYKSNDAVESYREYYRKDKKDLLKYKNREFPEWLL